MGGTPSPSHPNPLLPTSIGHHTGILTSRFPPKDHFPELQLLLVTALPEQALEAGLTVKAHQVLREHVADVLRQPCNHRVINGDACVQLALKGQKMHTE